MDRGTFAGAALAVAVMIAGIPAGSAAQVWYVDQSNPACSNGGPGTEAQPYCTISAAVAARKGAGVTIRVKPGTYREQVTIPGSGAAGDPYVIEAFGGTVRVDGADDRSSPAFWSEYADDIFRAASVTWSPQQVFRDGARLTRSGADPASLAAGEFTWVSGEGLYVNLGGDDPGTHELLVGRRSHGFLLSAKSWVRIEGFQVAHTESRGIYLNNACADVVLARDTVSFANSYGIQAVQGLRAVIERCQSSYNNLHGFGLTEGATACTLRANEAFGNADPAIRRANGIYLHASPGNVLVGNSMHHNQDSGFQFVSGADNCLAWNNRSWNNGDHGYDHLNAAGTIHLHDLASGNYKDGFSIEGVSPNTRLFNCIAVENGLTTDEYDLWVNTPSSPGFVSDHNIFWNSTGQAPIKYLTTKYTTLAAYQAASGQDAHSLQADPRFVDGSAGDFHLLAGSPAIDAATSGVPDWPPLDADGLPRFDDPSTGDTGAGPVTHADIGSFEYRVDRPPAVTAPAAIAGVENELLTFVVDAADPDGDPIASWLAEGLPPGASFTPAPGNASGTFSWTPTFADAGAFEVRFTASNALAGTDTTTITIVDVDRLPVFTLPPVATVAEEDSMIVLVRVSDPDGDPIDSLTVAGLPEGASFVVDPGDTCGTFRWTPVGGQAGTYTVTFRANQATVTADSTVITVTAGTTAVPGARPADGPLRPRVSPNPLRNAGHLRFTVARDGPVRVRLFDLSGRTVRTLMDERAAPAGEYDLGFEVGPGRSGAMHPGLYFYRVETGEGSARGRFVVVW